MAALITVFVFWKDEAREPATASRAAEGSEPPMPRLADLQEPTTTERATVAEPAQATSPATEPQQGVTVLVKDEREVPIAGATVRIPDHPDEGDFTTDADGRCWLAIRPDGPHQRLHATAEGYHHGILSRNRIADVTITLHRETGLQGSVLERGTGRAIAGARVLQGGRECGFCVHPAAVTDASGAFELEGLPLRSRVRVSASAPEYVSASRTFALEGNDAPLEILLEPGAALWVQVLDAESGEPIEGAAIRAGATTETTGPDGTVHARTLVKRGGRKTELIASALGYLNLRFDVDPSELDAGGLVSLRLPRGARVRGVVLNANGQAMANVHVSTRMQVGVEPPPAPGSEELPADWMYFGSNGRWGGGRTDEEGRFALDGFIPSTTGLKISAWRKGVEGGFQEVDLGGPGSTVQVTLTLRVKSVESGTIRGRMSLNGEPASGSVEWVGPTRSGSGRCAKGAFEFHDVEPGVVVLEPKPGFGGLLGLGYREVWPRPFEGDWSVEVRVGEVATLDFDLHVPLASIRGRVSHADGKPVAGVWVGARSDEAWRNDSTETDDEGLFTLEVQADVEGYSVSASHGRRRPRLTDIAPGTTDLELVVPRLAGLTWRAVDRGTSRPVGGAVLLWRRPPDKAYRSMPYNSRAPDSEGWRVIELEEGVYDLGVVPFRDAIHCPVFQYGVHVEGVGARTQFELARGLALELHLKEGPEAWPEDVLVFLLNDQHYDEAAGESESPFSSAGFFDAWRLRFDEGGVARLSALAEGRHRFRAFPATISIEPPEITVGTDTGPIDVCWSQP